MTLRKLKNMTARLFRKSKMWRNLQCLCGKHYWFIYKGYIEKVAEHNDEGLGPSRFGGDLFPQTYGTFKPTIQKHVCWNCGIYRTVALRKPLISQLESDLDDEVFLTESDTLL